jgi:hypothetical protein
VTQQLSSLQITATFDASKCASGAAQKVAADEKMAQSSAAAGSALAQADVAGS